MNDWEAPLGKPGYEEARVTNPAIGYITMSIWLGLFVAAAIGEITLMQMVLWVVVVFIFFAMVLKALNARLRKKQSHG